MILVAILADTQGRLDARVEASVADCDLAVHGGDIGSAGVLGRLHPRQGRIIAVTGNNDSPRKWPSEQRHLLDSLREQSVQYRRQQVPLGRRGAVSGWNRVGEIRGNPCAV